MKPSLVFDEAYQLVLEDEQQRELNNPTSVGMDSTALNSYHRQYNGQGRGQGGSTLGSNRGEEDLLEEQEVAQTMELVLHGHTIDRCYRLHGYPEQRNEQARPPQANATTDEQYEEIPSTVSSSNSQAHSMNKSQVLGEMHGGLYIAKHVPATHLVSDSREVLNPSACSVSSTLWHYMLGHIALSL
ncbi:hypothetical protein V2J09_009486 [Rumex salicifolius]